MREWLANSQGDFPGASVSQRKRYIAVMDKLTGDGLKLVEFDSAQERVDWWRANNLTEASFIFSDWVPLDSAAKEPPDAR